MMIENFNKDVHEMQNNYVDNYRRWVKVFGCDNVKVEFYDKIVSESRSLVENILQFLGLSDTVSEVQSKDSGRRVNASCQVEIPEKAKVYLASKYIEKIYETDEVFGSYARKWKEEANNILKEREVNSF